MKPHPHSVAQAASLAAHLNWLAKSGHGEDTRRLDADETNMLALALEQMRSRVYETEYPELRARKYLPVAGDIDPGAESFAYEETDEVGQAKVISDGHYTDDLPSVETYSTKMMHSVITLGDGFEYSIQDLRRAAFSGRPLTARKAQAARRVYERALDSIAALGAPNDGIPNGFCNRTIGTSAGQVRGTAMTSAAWDSSPDAATMVADLNKGVQEYISDCKEIHTPEILGLPILQFLRLQHTFTTDGNPESAMDRFLKSNGFVRQVVPWDKLKSVDGSGGNYSRGVLFKKDPDCSEIVIPQEFEVLPIQPKNLGFKGLAFGRTAGFCLYRPLSMRYLSGLPDT